MENKKDIGKITREIKEKIHQGNTEAENKEIAELIMKLLEWKFLLKIEDFIPTNTHSKIFKFLIQKNRTSREYEGHNMMSGVEAPNMDRDFFIKYSDKLFFPFESDYIFEDSKKTITLDHDGGFYIKENAT